MVQNAICTTAPGAIRTRRRKAKIGSSTAPTVFESGRPSIIAIGASDAVAAAEETGPVGLDLRLTDGFAVDDGEMRRPDFAAPSARAVAGSPGWRRRRRDIRSRTNSLEKAGCASSAAWRCQHQLGIGGDHRSLARRLPEFEIETRRTSASSSAETSTSMVVVSVPSRRVNSARSSLKTTS